MEFLLLLLLCTGVQRTICLSAAVLPPVHGIVTETENYGSACFKSGVNCQMFHENTVKVLRIISEILKRKS